MHTGARVAGGAAIAASASAGAGFFADVPAALGAAPTFVAAVAATTALGAAFGAAFNVAVPVAEPTAPYSTAACACASPASPNRLPRSTAEAMPGTRTRLADGFGRCLFMFLLHDLTLP